MTNLPNPRKGEQPTPEPPKKPIAPSGAGEKLKPVTDDFYISTKDAKNRFVKVQGEPVKIKSAPNHEFFIHQNVVGVSKKGNLEYGVGYTVTEASTGSKIATRQEKEDAVKEVNRIIKEKGVEKLQELLDKRKAEIGLSPRYKAEEKPQTEAVQKPAEVNQKHRRRKRLRLHPRYSRLLMLRFVRDLKKQRWRPMQKAIQ